MCHLPRWTLEDDPVVAQLAQNSQAIIGRQILEWSVRGFPLCRCVSHPSRYAVLRHVVCVPFVALPGRVLWCVSVLWPKTRGQRRESLLPSRWPFAYAVDIADALGSSHVFSASLNPCGSDCY